MELKIIDRNFSVCKVSNLHEININAEYLFIAKTDEEISIVCETEKVPNDTLECEHG